MRKIILVFILMIVFVSVSKSTHIDGIWYNPYLNKNIYLNQYTNGIQVRGIRTRSGWTWFERCGNNIFCDRYKNKIMIISKNRLVYYKNNRRVKLTFYPASVRDRHGSSSILYGDQKRTQSSYQNEGQDGDDYVEYRNPQNEDYVKNSFRSNTIEGTWRSLEIDKKVYIIDTRDGIKARFSDNPKWYIFKTDEKRANIFIDMKGNQYEYMNDGSLIWSESTGQRKYHLTKVSSDIED